MINYWISGVCDFSKAASPREGGLFSITLLEEGGFNPFCHTIFKI